MAWGFVPVSSSTRRYPAVVELHDELYRPLLTRCVLGQLDSELQRIAHPADYATVLSLRDAAGAGDTAGFPPRHPLFTEQLCALSFFPARNGITDRSYTPVASYGLKYATVDLRILEALDLQPQFRDTGGGGGGSGVLGSAGGGLGAPHHQQAAPGGGGGGSGVLGASPYVGEKIGFTRTGCAAPV